MNASTNLLTLPHADWRLIISPALDGAANMAIDEAILETAAAGIQPPTLRLYAWLPAALSLGYAQSAADADLDALAQNDWDLVRRPTGGRAILHTDELTYSVTGPQYEPRLAGGVLESYRRLSLALLEALHRLDIPAEAHGLPAAQPIASEPTGSAKNPVCFEVPSNYEIVVSGKKLIGSAQARRAEGVLQHGSLPLYGDLTRITRVLKFETPAARQRAVERLLERAVTAENILGKPLSWELACQAFIAAFEDTLSITLHPSDLTAAELERAQSLAAQKYRHPDWNFRI